MSDIFLIPIIGLVVIVVVLGVAGFLRFLITRRWNRHKAETIDRWAAEGLEFTLGPTAGQFGGLESLGFKQTKLGLGYVALTAKDLRVTRAVPSNSWVVNLRQIKGVSLEPRFMGKTAKKTPFIVVRFKKGGQADRLAFQVKEAGAWAKTLAAAANVRLKRET